MKRWVLIGVVVLGVGVCAALVLQRNRGMSTTNTAVPPASSGAPHSFAECVAQGYPIQETQPRRCQAGKIGFIDNPNSDAQSVGGMPVMLDNMPAGSVIQSPVTLHGKARGNWFFEASFPVRVLDAQGNVVGESTARADANWQTVEYVPFTATVNFSQPKTDTGFIEFAKDNPSGLPEMEASTRMPVRFK